MRQHENLYFNRPMKNAIQVVISLGKPFVKVTHVQKRWSTLSLTQNSIYIAVGHKNP